MSNVDITKEELQKATVQELRQLLEQEIKAETSRYFSLRSLNILAIKIELAKRLRERKEA